MSITEATFKFGSKLEGDVQWGCKFGRDGTQRSIHNLVFDPFAIYHWAPLRTRSQASSKLDQAQEAQLPFRASMKVEWEKYLLLRIFDHHTSGSMRRHQHYLARRVRLNSWKFLKPIPPFCFTKLSFSQLTQWIFFSCSFWPYQKLAIMGLNSLNRELGMRKMLMG